MKRVSILALASIILIGCGGSGSSPSGPSPLVGEYEGTYNLTRATEAGTFNLTISEDRTVGGSFQTGTQIGGVDGTVDDAGNASLTVTYSNTASTDTVGAVLKKSAAGSSYDITGSGNGVSGTFTVAGNGTKSAVKSFVGTYSGSYKTSQPSSGTFTLTVDAAKKVTGTFKNGPTTGTVKGSLLGSGRFSGTVTYSGGAVTDSIEGVIGRRPGTTTSFVIAGRERGSINLSFAGVGTKS